MPGRAVLYLHAAAKFLDRQPRIAASPAKSLCGYLRGASSADPRANAMSGDLGVLPPARIDVGDHEVLLADLLRFEAAAQAGATRCEVHLWKGMVHVFPSNVAMLKAASEAFDGAGAFLEAAFGKSLRSTPVG